jgi:hypothetical protein
MTQRFGSVLFFSVPVRQAMISIAPNSLYHKELLPPQTVRKLEKPKFFSYINTVASIIHVESRIKILLHCIFIYCRRVFGQPPPIGLLVSCKD